VNGAGLISGNAARMRLRRFAGRLHGAAETSLGLSRETPVQAERPLSGNAPRVRPRRFAERLNRASATALDLLRETP
jgi:hypothetical protein